MPQFLQVLFLCFLRGMTRGMARGYGSGYDSGVWLAQAPPPTKTKEQKHRPISASLMLGKKCIINHDHYRGALLFHICFKYAVKPDKKRVVTIVIGAGWQPLGPATIT